MAKSDYEIGYGKPPKHTRFKPGESGNRNGRPRGSLGLRAELMAELSQKVAITENGKTQRIPKRRLVIKSLVAKAAKGDVRAADRLLHLIIQAEGFEDRRSNRNRLSELDRQILARLLGEDIADCAAGSDQEEVLDTPIGDPGTDGC